MTETRKNLKIQPETYKLLESEKRKYETWDGTLRRLVTETQNDN